jgi:hypothetical protein
LDDKARKLILACETGGGTVGELLAEVNSGTEPLKSFTSSMLVLYEMGIALTSGGRSLGLEHEAFATVTNGTKLRKYVRELRKLDVPLEGMGVY